MNRNPNVYFKNMAILDKKLLDILICPVSKKPLKYDEEANELISDEACLAYPLRMVFLSCFRKKLGSYNLAPVAQLDRVLGYERS